MAPRRMVPSDRAMTALRPPIRPTSDVMAPTIPLPTTGASSTWVTTTECRPGGVPAVRRRTRAAGTRDRGRGERELAVVRLGPAPGPGAAAGLLPQRHVLHGHG